MLEDIRKSINSTLYERVSSPFWGALIFAWITINWRILYVTFFVSEDKLANSKLDYIEGIVSGNYCDILVWPIIVALVLVLVVPLISNGVYWVYLYFNKWKINKKREIEGTITLPIRKSLEIRNQLYKQEENFRKLESEKDERIVEINKKFDAIQILLNGKREELEVSEKAIESLEGRMKGLMLDNDYSNVFSGDWAYETSKNDKTRFSIQGKNKMNFDGKSSPIQINTISRYTNREFTLLLMPEDIDYRDEYEVKLIIVKRSKDNIDNFVGREICFEKDASGEQTGIENSLILRKL